MKLTLILTTLFITSFGLNQTIRKSSSKALREGKEHLPNDLFESNDTLFIFSWGGYNQKHKQKMIELIDENYFGPIKTHIYTSSNPTGYYDGQMGNMARAANYFSPRPKYILICGDLKLKKPEFEGEKAPNGMWFLSCVIYNTETMERYYCPFWQTNDMKGVLRTWLEFLEEIRKK